MLPSLGSSSSFASADTCQLFGCGSSEFGILGTGEQKLIGPDLLFHRHSIPVPISLHGGILQIVCGYRHSMALSETGQVYSWGCGHWGALGHGIFEDVYVPLAIDWEPWKEEKIVRIAAGPFHSAAITELGHVYTWGRNNACSCGHGDEEVLIRPRLVENLLHVRVVDVAFGNAHILFLTDDGRVFGCGANTNGSLGLGDDQADCAIVLNPTEVMFSIGRSRVRITSISCGCYHNLAVDKDGVIYSWGRGSEGQLGHNEPRDLHYPKAIKTLQTIKIMSLACGRYFSLCLSRDHNVYSWGYAGKRRCLGLSSEYDSMEFVRLPSLIKFLRAKTIVSISAGSEHAACVTSGGALYMWGSCTHGQSGGGMEKDSGLTVHRVRLRGRAFRAVACGDVHSLLLSPLTRVEEIKEVQREKEVIEEENKALMKKLEELQSRLSDVEIDEH